MRWEIKPKKQTALPWNTGHLVLAACFTFSLAGCNGGDSTLQRPDEPRPETRVALPLTDQAQAAHERLQTAATELRRQVEALLANPEKDSLQAARNAWRTAHIAYKATRLYQNLGLEHPQFDQSSTDPVAHRLWDRLDTYPLEPGYLDYVEGYPFSGLVFAESVPINPASLNDQHQLTDRFYVTLGFHALEFLLWGENQDQDTRRAWQDYAKVKEGADVKEGTQPNERTQSRLRRRQLLDTLSAMLSQDLQALATAWQPSGNIYPSAWAQIPEAQRGQRLRKAVVNTLRQEIAQPLQRLLSLENKEWDSAMVESAFSHNGKADLQATLAPITALYETPDRATTLGFDPAQWEHLTSLHQQLLKAIEGLKDGAFFPTGARLSKDDLAAVRAASELTSAQLELLQTN